MSDLPVDPKHPVGTPAPWSECWLIMRAKIKNHESLWNRAFAAVVAADGVALAPMRECYPEVIPAKEGQREPFRTELWSRLEGVFESEPDAWPGYARAVADAVQADPAFQRALDELEVGERDELARHFFAGPLDRPRVLKVLTFKLTLVLVSGLFEKGLSADLLS
jgi:hypothetical protein